MTSLPPDEASRDLAASVETRLMAFLAEPGRHARFLNMLSLMEHIGSRKIMGSQGKTGWSHETLKHLAEETRHACFFKRAAERLSGRALSYADADTLAGPSARAYMGRLDAEITRTLNGVAPLPYLYMSLVIEWRALWLYRLYQHVLTKRPTGISLKSVLAEEELHLDLMLARLKELDAAMNTHMREFAGLEDRLFRRLWQAIDTDAWLTGIAAE